MIIVPTNIPLGIRWNESIILVVRKWVLVVLILMWIYAVALGWGRQRKVVWLMIVWICEVPGFRASLRGNLLGLSRAKR